MWDQTLIFDELTLYGSPEEIARNPPEVVVEIFDKDLIVSDIYLHILFIMSPSVDCPSYFLVYIK